MKKMYRKVALDMYEVGFKEEEVKNALMALDKIVGTWHYNARSREAGRLAKKYWDVYGDKVAKEIEEQARGKVARKKAPRVNAYPHLPKMSRPEQAAMWIMEFLSRKGMERVMVTRILSFGYMEHRFTSQQMQDGMKILVEENKIEKTRTIGRGNPVYVSKKE